MEESEIQMLKNFILKYGYNETFKMLSKLDDEIYNQEIGQNQEVKENE